MPKIDSVTKSEFDLVLNKMMIGKTILSDTRGIALDEIIRSKYKIPPRNADHNAREQYIKQIINIDPNILQDSLKMAIILSWFDAQTVATINIDGKNSPFASNWSVGHKYLIDRMLIIALLIDEDVEFETDVPINKLKEFIEETKDEELDQNFDPYMKTSQLTDSMIKVLSDTSKDINKSNLSIRTNLLSHFSKSLKPKVSTIVDPTNVPPGPSVIPTNPAGVTNIQSISLNTSPTPKDLLYTRNALDSVLKHPLDNANDYLEEFRDILRRGYIHKFSPKTVDDRKLAVEHIFKEKSSFDTNKTKAILLFDFDAEEAGFEINDEIITKAIDTTDAQIELIDELLRLMILEESGVLMSGDQIEDLQLLLNQINSDVDSDINLEATFDLDDVQQEQIDSLIKLSFDKPAFHQLRSNLLFFHSFPKGVIMASYSNWDTVSEPQIFAYTNWAPLNLAIQVATRLLAINFSINTQRTTARDMLDHLFEIQDIVSETKRFPETGRFISQSQFEIVEITRKLYGSLSYKDNPSSTRSNNDNRGPSEYTDAFQAFQWAAKDFHELVRQRRISFTRDSFEAIYGLTWE